MKTTKNKKPTGARQKPANLIKQTGLQLLPLIINNLPQAMFWKDCELVYLGCNQAFAEDAGFSSPEDIVGRTDFDMPWKDQAELYRADDQQVIQSGQSKLNYEEPHTTPDRLTWVRTSKIPVREDDQVVAILGMYEDIAARKQAEHAQQQSDLLFTDVFDLSPDAVVLIDPNDPNVSWSIINCNAAACQMSGFQRDELIGHSIDVLNTNVGTQAERIAYKKSLQEAGILKLETYHRHKDGTIFPVEVSTRLIKIAGRELVLGMDRDITERKQAEARFRTMVENAPEAIVVVDLTTGLFTEPNENAVKLYGLSREELVKVGPAEMSPPVQPDGRQSTEKAMEKINAAMQGEAPVFAWTHRNARGEDIPCEVRLVRLPGNLPLVRASVTDISERKRAEDVLHKANARVQAVLDAATHEAIIATDPDGIITIFNAGAEQMLGYSAEELVGEQSPAILHLESEVVARGKELSAEFGRPIEGFDVFVEYAKQGRYDERNWTYVHKNGAHLTVSLVVTALRDSAGNIIGFLGVARDITERTLAEEALHKANARVQAVLDAVTHEAIIATDPDGLLTVFNTGAERMLGYSAEELVGKQSPAILHLESEVVARGKELSAEFGRPIEGFDVFVEYARQGRYEERNWTYVNKDGAHLTVSLAVTALRDSAGNIIGFLGVARDITERRRLEQQIQTAFERRGYQVQISTEISQEVASASELSDLFGRVVTLTKERLGYYHTQLLRYEATQDAVVLINGYGETGQKMLAKGHKMPMGSGLIGTAAASGQTILRPALAEDPDWQPNPLLPDTRGEIAVPIKLGEQVLGVLDVQSDQAGALTEDDRLLLEGLCGQIAVAMEGTRLRQEMAERLEEVNRLYQSMSHEGWKTYRDTTNLPAGFIYDQVGIRPVDEEVLAGELFTNVPMRVLGGEVVGTLTVADDPQHPITPEDYVFLQQVSDQVALALESARLSAQTQSALAQMEKLSEAGLRFARSADLQELLAVVNEMIGIPVVNRMLLGIFNYSSANELESMDVVANWGSGSGHEPTEIGRHYTLETLNTLPIFMSVTPAFSSDTFDDERIAGVSLQLVKQQNIRSMAVLPLYLGSRQTGVLLLEAEEAHNFTQDEIRIFSAVSPQIATVLENRRQYQRAQQQADRESTLNVISQKIQSATTVEAVLQIAARELGHALGAPMTIAQLSMKDKQ